MSLEDAFKSDLWKRVLELEEENKEVHEAVIRKSKELMKLKMGMVTEECPDCGCENTIAWNVAKKRYHAFCPNCGFPMMLCSICILDNNGFCNWDGKESLCYRMIEGFWNNLSDVPFIEAEDGRILLEKDCRLMIGTREVVTFWTGTDREEIWHWFDERYPNGVVHLLYGDNAITEQDVYFSVEDGNDVQIDKSFTKEGAITMCKHNINAKEVFEFRKKDGEYELIGCVYSKCNEGEKDECKTEK